ncbi:hypothetical protein JTB14_032709 [Gonioctena quinquepunctata]|nr:hypothetical protein JTB14_032709 [Gonioctena quinquepunctata]
MNERVDPEQIDEFGEDELLAAASRIKAGKAPGPDSIPPEIIKVAVTVIPRDLLRILNGLLREQSFPRSLKEAKLVLILKPGKPEVKLDRQTCLLDCIGKLYERIIFERILDELQRVGAISEFQYGLRTRKCIGKLYERIIFERLLDELQRVGAISEFQYGLRTRKSTVQAAE